MYVAATLSGCLRRTHIRRRYILEESRSYASLASRTRRWCLPHHQPEGRNRPGENITLIKQLEVFCVAAISPRPSRRLRLGVSALLALAPLAAAAQNKLALAPTATYDNHYEVFGGINFANFQAGQNLAKRMNFAGAEAQGTWWFTNRLGATADYRFEGGTTPVLPNNRYNRVAVFQNNFLAGVTARGPKGRYAAIDYHAFGGVSQGTFDSAFSNPGTTFSLTPTQVGLYTNRTKPMFALGGSVDFNYSKNIAIRIQPDLILEHYSTELREFVAVSGGIVYRFGKR